MFLFAEASVRRTGGLMIIPVWRANHLLEILLVSFSERHH